LDIFYIIIISLLLHPILAKTVLLSFKNNPKEIKKVIFAFVGSSLLIILSMILGVSTTSSTIDFILFFSVYFSISLLLLRLYSFKNKAVKIFAGVLQFCVFGIGYLSCTIGILGVGLISNDFRVDREIIFTDGIVYRQYSLGSAPGDYHGIQVSIQKRIKWLPGFEKEIFSKKYDLGFYHDSLSTTADQNKTPKLYSYNFKVKYLPISKQIVLLDSVKKDTVSLNR
jgi:hypothetical protein